ncbi:MAG: tRNA (adenosine(37)-N6)-dimethylallyltransferase MiaA [Kiloniellaceae bacterium]
MSKTLAKGSAACPVVVVTGPTASGKSGLALALAEAFDGVVINADSMQVYRELAILTARPAPEDLARAPHRLYGVLPGRARCSAGRWRRLALAEIAACHAAGKLPLVVGGTGLYLRALEKGLARVPEVPRKIRDAARALHRKLGAAGFQAALAQRDPVMAARLEPGDTQRLIRAWEVLDATGRSLAAWQAGGTGTAGEDSGPAPYRFLRLVCLPPREALYAACNARVLGMIERGALDELRALLALDLDPELPVMKALGVAELSRHLAGDCSLEHAIARAQQATRRYAKRQMTWLRTQMPQESPATMFLNEQYSKSLDPEIFKIIHRFLLTG